MVASMRSVLETHGLVGENSALVFEQGDQGEQSRRIRERLAVGILGVQETSRWSCVTAG